MIEICPLNMQAWPLVGEIAEPDFGDLAGPVDDLPPALLNEAAPLDLLADTEPVEILPGWRQNALPDGFARVKRPVDKDDIVSAPGELGRCHAARGSAADNEDIGFIRQRHRHVSHVRGAAN